MEVTDTISGLQEYLSIFRRDGEKVGFIPTMGALHEGHASLVDAAVADNDFVVVSIFVNPLQFAPDEDLDSYPRDLLNDLRICEDHGADLIFTPSFNEIYPNGDLESVGVGSVALPLEGEARPDHFAGVAAVVSRLFKVMGPCWAYFGEKDFQQIAVVKELVMDQGLEIEVVACPTVREDDGLALSSRNAYLSLEERNQAPILYRALQAGVVAIEEGEIDLKKVTSLIVRMVEAVPDARLEYAAIVDPVTFVTPSFPVDSGVPLRLLVSCWFGSARLIDNLGVQVP